MTRQCDWLQERWKFDSQNLESCEFGQMNKKMVPSENGSVVYNSLHRHEQWSSDAEKMDKHVSTPRILLRFKKFYVHLKPYNGLVIGLASLG